MLAGVRVQRGERKPRRDRRRTAAARARSARWCARRGRPSARAARRASATWTVASTTRSAGDSNIIATNGLPVRCAEQVRVPAPRQPGQRKRLLADGRRRDGVDAPRAGHPRRRERSRRRQHGRLRRWDDQDRTARSDGRRVDEPGRRPRGHLDRPPPWRRSPGRCPHGSPTVIEAEASGDYINDERIHSRDLHGWIRHDTRS